MAEAVQLSDDLKTLRPRRADAEIAEGGGGAAALSWSEEPALSWSKGRPHRSIVNFRDARSVIVL